MLKDDFVCGYKDISRKHYAGASGKHRPDENAVDTTNGAGPHNLQMFILASDGTVLTCMPGYWHSEDLAKELRLAFELNKIWQAHDLSLDQKKALFSQIQLAHIQDHGAAEHKRSQMQGFDIQYEAQHRPNSDFFINQRAVDAATGKVDQGNLKPVDVVMHQRMAARPFEPYEKFDVAVYSDYGKPMYDKHEQFRDANGNIIPNSNLASEPMIGNDPRAHPIETQVKHQGKSAARQAIMFGIRAALAH
ncbi:MAG: hypothetical protein C5B53_01170 [Candidatus Melainabacteria bacterium]|nr:MAG: hypothetical protein C5B53_01170 [Candidatus Melainabacteria bacterium]